MLLRGPERLDRVLALHRVRRCRGGDLARGGDRLRLGRRAAALHRDASRSTRRCPRSRPTRSQGCSPGSRACRTVKVKVAERGRRSRMTWRGCARRARSWGRRAASGSTRTAAGTWTRPSAPSTRSPRSTSSTSSSRARPCPSSPSCARGCTTGMPIAADESVRKAADPLAVARAGRSRHPGAQGAAARRRHRRAADRGRGRAAGRRLERARHLGRASRWACSSPPPSPSSSSTAASATAALLAADVTAEPLLPRRRRASPVRRVEAERAALLDAHAAIRRPRRAWWRARLERCYRLLAASIERASRPTSPE